LRDPAIDLDVSGKELDDKAIAEVARALESVLKANHKDGIIARLDEICLAGNSLTTRSLTLLSPVIRLAAGELKDLDLSKNNISVETEVEVSAWEEFLSSFAGSKTLRRIDLSGNPLSTKAFEILTRVYSGQRTVRNLQILETASLKQARSNTLSEASSVPLSRPLQRRGTIANGQSSSNRLRGTSIEGFPVSEEDSGGAKPVGGNGFP
jgi:Ran GTPase-activating protein (RanGAP) involved in mRNA processing and transport